MGIIIKSATKSKVVTSKRQTDFQNQLDRVLDSINTSDDFVLQDIHYAIAATSDGKDIVHSALVTYWEQKEGDAYESFYFATNDRANR